MSVDETVQLLRTFRGDFDLDTNYTYGVFASDESRLLGGCGLHPRGGPDSLEIGYFVRADSVGQGYATETAAALTRVGFEICGLVRVDLQIEPDNEQSLKIPKKLGFTHEGTLRRRLDPRDDGLPRADSMVFTMLREELAGSPCLQYDYVAYDVVGKRLGQGPPRT
jgi:RimJ/RimL family protein N-acetyltransferase